MSKKPQRKNPTKRERKAAARKPPLIATHTRAPTLSDLLKGQGTAALLTQAGPPSRGMLGGNIRLSGSVCVVGNPAVRMRPGDKLQIEDAYIEHESRFVFSTEIALARTDAMASARVSSATETVFSAVALRPADKLTQQRIAGRLAACFDVDFEVVAEEHEGQGVDGDPAIDVLLRAVPADPSRNVKIQVRHLSDDVPADLGMFGATVDASIAIRTIQAAIHAKAMVDGIDDVELVLLSPVTLGAMLRDDSRQALDKRGYRRVWICALDSEGDAPALVAGDPPRAG